MTSALRTSRWRSHLLHEPAPTLAAAATHMAAIQSQELWGGKFALASRAAGAPSSREVDAAFDTGRIVRTWPMRGTLHIIAADDVGWMLPLTAERVMRSAAPRHRELGLSADDFHGAEWVWRRTLSAGALRRADALAALNVAGIDTAGQRAAHIILALAVRGVVHWGASAARADGAPATEQLLTLNDFLPTQRSTPDEPMAELVRRYLRGHAPASTKDFAWWSGQPITVARRAFSIVAADDVTSDELRWCLDDQGRGVPWESSEVLDLSTRALPTFEEYYISYADRSAVADTAARAAIGPGRNGMVKAIVVADGRVTGTWTRGGELSLFEGEESSARTAVAAWQRHFNGLPA